jgi:hypothetical protein
MRSAGEFILNTFDAMVWANIVEEINVWTLISLRSARVSDSSERAMQPADFNFSRDDKASSQSQLDRGD